MSIFKRYNEATISNEAHTLNERDPVKSLYLACEAISCEASVLSSVGGWFARKGAGAAMDIAAGFKKLTTFDWKPMQPLHPNPMYILLRSKDYMSFEDQMVSQPSGFSGDLNEYITKMAPRVALAIQIDKNVIGPAKILLGRYLTEPKERDDRRGFPPGAAAVAQIGQLLAEEQKFFQGGDNVTAPFGSLFGNFAEFIDAERKMNTYADLLNKNQPASVRKSVSELSDIAGALFKSLSAENTPVSRELTVEIGKQLESVARWVEWYAVQVTHLTETLNCLHLMEDALRKN